MHSIVLYSIKVFKIFNINNAAGCIAFEQWAVHSLFATFRSTCHTNLRSVLNLIGYILYLLKYLSSWKMLVGKADIAKITVFALFFWFTCNTDITLKIKAVYCFALVLLECHTFAIFLYKLAPFLSELLVVIFDGFAT